MEKIRQNILKYLLDKNPKDLVKSRSFKDISCTKKARDTEVLFPLTFVCSSLTSIDNLDQNAEIIEYISRCVELIKNELNDSHSFNYWIRNSELDQTLPLPDDLDDTSYALSALNTSNQEISEQYLLKIINLEDKPGGPYRTWYINKEDEDFEKWSDIDPIVNTNLLQLMASFGINLPNTVDYLVSKIRSNNISSPYYPYEIIFYYYFSKYYKYSNDEKIGKLLIEKINKYTYSELSNIEKIFFCIVKTNLGLKVSENELNKITKLQSSDGSFPPMAFCYDFSFEKKKTYAGSEIMSSALVLELLNELIPTKVIQSTEQKLIEKTIGTQQKLIEETKIFSKDWNKLLKEDSFKDLTKKLSIPISLALSIKEELSTSDIENISDLTLAIYFCWFGYTLQDNIIDGQSDVKYIPNSNILIRKGFTYYAKLFKKFPPIQKQIMQAFQDCDENYMWESEYARFDNKNIKKLLQEDWNTNYIEKRMQPFLISLKIVPLILRLPNEFSNNIYTLFKSQSIINQLNDDSHDWQEDQSNGIMTYVLSKLYKNDSNPKNHQRLFWEKIIDEVVDECEELYKIAEMSIEKIKPKTNYLNQILDESIRPIHTVKNEKKKVKRIIKSYK